MSNELNADYFTKKLNLICRDISHYTPQEMARELIRLAKVADESEAINEAGQPAARSAVPAQASAPAAVTDLHAAIMNLPCRGFDHAYKEGHRDARHAAAELAAAAQVPAQGEIVAKPLAHGNRDDYYLMVNCRNMLTHPKWKAAPNWSVASALFATGSTSARQICVDAGIDPEGYKVERAAMSRQGAEGGR